MIDSTTLEEANSQRPQLDPPALAVDQGLLPDLAGAHAPSRRSCSAQLGPRAFVSFNLIVGGAFIFLLNPIFWALTTLFFFTQAGFIQSSSRLLSSTPPRCMLFLGNFIFVYFNVAGSLQPGNFRPDRVRAVLTDVLGADVVGGVEGLLQLLYRPFYWEKTTHGLDIGHQDTPELPAPASSAAAAPVAEITP